MKSFDIRSIFCSERLRRIQSENVSVRKASSVNSKDSLKKSMDELLTEIVSSLTPDSPCTAIESDYFSDHKIIH